MARFVTGGAHSGVTAVENAFIIDYMPLAPENAVKAYIYALMAASRSDAPDISEALGLDDEALSSIFAYWQRMGLVRIVSPDPLVIELLRPQGISSSPRKYAALIEKLTSAVPQRVFTGDELRVIYDWIEVFGFCEDTAVLLVSDCVKRRGARLKLWQMNAEAKLWADAGVSTVEEALEYIALRDERTAGAQKILSRWKLRRAATNDEVALYIKWHEQWGMTDEVIAEACKELTSAAQPSFKYLDSVLTTFRANGAITPEAINTLRHEQDACRELARIMLERVGLNRAPTSVQQQDVDMWRNRYRIAPELLMLAAEAARQSEKPWGSIKRTIARWHDNGITELERAKADIEAQASKRISSSGANKGRALSHASRAYSESELERMGVELLED